MRTTSHITYFIAIAAGLVSIFGACSRESFPLTTEQRALIGTPVNFSASIVDPFITKVTYSDDGNFNEGDLMYIYRQYKEGEVFETEPVTFHVYTHDSQSAEGWVPAAGKTGWDKDIPGTVPGDHYAFVQNKNSYINWDNDKTVRFRSAFRGNYAGTRTGSKSNYYPDFGLSDWVSAGGPTKEIPFHIAHLGSRIVFSPRNDISANQIQRIEICTEAADYERDDNADTEAHDSDDKWGDAATKAAAVKAVYDRMCMPSGVDIDAECLFAMDKAYYDAHSSFEDVETYANAAAHVSFATKTPAEVVDDIQRPVFTSRVNSSCYLITIPYDFSNGSGSGEVLTLPAYTRFRVYMYDVNNGDKENSTGVEKTYHIFALNDLTDGGGNAIYPDGLRMGPGTSYRFRVGYRYKTFTVERDPNTSWSQQDMDDIEAEKDTPESLTLTYEWWMTEMNAKAEEAVLTNNFDPVFDIGNLDQLVSCLNLVNGTATTKTGAASELKHAFTESETSPGTSAEGWYDPTTGILPGGDTVWVRLDGVNKVPEYFEIPGNEDYIFYKHYHPQDGDKAAYIEEDYLMDNFSFYDATLNKHFTINLTADFDLKDVQYPGMGYYPGTKFMGIMEGNMHTISNAYMLDGYMFETVEGATIKDLTFTSTHPLSMVKEVVGDGKLTTIAGVSLVSKSDNASFVESVAENSELTMVGCFYDGDAGKGLIGTTAAGSKITMLGCMNTGLVETGGALCYSDGSGTLKPFNKVGQEWGTFTCNYYNTERNPGAVAVGSTADAYVPAEYIRGEHANVLKAREDLMLPYKAAYNPKYYGYAAWRAMNAAIDHYNEDVATTDAEKCNAKYVHRTSSAFDNCFPNLVSTKVPSPNPITAAEGAGLYIPGAEN